MKKVCSFVFGAALALALLVPASAAEPKIIKGEVIDLECSLSNGDAGKGEAHAACALGCARDGDQMAILTDEAVYLIEGDYAANKNAKLLDFVARKVQAKGTVSEKDGKMTINVAAMAVAK
ncbi:MAG: hypothetical protein ABI880_05705 [Acidobacteriota bacterium]